jgi:3-hydroxyacyl-CoA dehydrogenase
MVEVVPGKDTAAATKAWLMSFYEAIGKVPIPVKSRYGYAIDPMFEGLFSRARCSPKPESARRSRSTSVCKKTFKMGIGSFTR